MLAIPGIAGHASQTSPAALALGLDWVHLVCGSLWIGGLLGLLVVWFATPSARRRPALALVVPRFSSVAFVSVLALLASGVAASYLHLPTLASLWQTSYGKVILIKAALLAVTMLIAAVNLLVTRPRLAAAGIREDSRRARARAAATSGGERDRPRDRRRARRIGADEPAAAARRRSRTWARRAPRSVRAPCPGSCTRARTSSACGSRRTARRFPTPSPSRSRAEGTPLRGAEVTMRFTMLDMDEQQQIYTLPRARRRHLLALGARRS